MGFRKLAYWSVFCMILLISCEDKPVIKTISSDDVLTTVVIAEQGSLVNPIFQDTSEFVGFPGALSKEVDNDEHLYLIIGQKLKLRKKIKTKALAKISFRKSQKNYHLILAIPLESKYQTLYIEDYEDLNIEFGGLKLWIQDWLQNAYKSESIRFQSWGPVPEH